MTIKVNKLIFETIGHCAEHSEMPEEDFIKLLSENNISIFDFSDYDSLKEDLANA